MSRGLVLMVQGTMSNAGKSVLTAALCRIFARRGIRVAPFKSQNMSNNSFATSDGGEIGRAQAVQAEAAMTVPTVEMNPILLKPEADHRSQVVVMGKSTGSATAREYYSRKLVLWPVVTGALDRLRDEFDLVIIEGAGSPAEINLKAHEIVNMRVARHASAPVLLVGDIDRGGVFASLVGTIELLEPEERSLVKGFVINKFRGDPTLLTPGFEMLFKRTRIPTLGVLPFFTDLHIPEEDSLGLRDSIRHEEPVLVDVAVLRLPHIANFDDFDPLTQEPGVRVRFVESAEQLGTPDLVILPGSKTTLHDLVWLKSRGIAEAIVTLSQQGTPVVGICAGFQMLGERILDPEGNESQHTEARGLGLLPVTTEFAPGKVTVQTEARLNSARGLLRGANNETIRGYEIHMGRTPVPRELAAFKIERRSGQTTDDWDGAMDAHGKVLGTYMHGLFHNPGLRRAMLDNVAARKGLKLAPGVVTDPDREFDKLADLVGRNMDLPAMCKATGLTELWS